VHTLNPTSAAPSVTTEVIRVRGLTFTYPKAPEPAVRGMDFTVGRGEIFGFLGPSGAGKSTTQKLLIGLLRGHGGQASVWGKDPLAWGPGYYQRIGVSFELPNHYQKLTGLENLRFFASLYAGPTLDPIQLLGAVGLADDAHTRVSKYSEGMQMRLTFARSLLNDPELLFLDEPTSGLDPVNARKVKNMILDLKAIGFFFIGATVFFEKQEHHRRNHLHPAAVVGVSDRQIDCVGADLAVRRGGRGHGRTRVGLPAGAAGARRCARDAADAAGRVRDVVAVRFGH
jgi:ABC-type Na+ transport system ATPase subunit NatA